MLEQDYIVKQIKEMIRMLLKLLFNIDTENPAIEMLETEVEQTAMQELLDRVDSGDIGGAEDVIFDMADEEGKEKLDFILIFFSYLNEKPDSFLEANDFSRHEIKEDLGSILKKFGYEYMIETFLE